jgi:hypothetical protein
MAFLVSEFTKAGGVAWGPNCVPFESVATGGALLAMMGRSGGMRRMSAENAVSMIPAILSG